MKLYRDTGAVGAILDEYEKAIHELIAIIDSITHGQLVVILDTDTQDEDCRSIQTILTHVLRAGYGYADSIRLFQGDAQEKKETELLNSVEEYIAALKKMFDYNVLNFSDYPDLKLEEYDNQNKMLTVWGQRYDVEQLMEHAIVHVLRHRRQIERFILRLELK